MIWFGSIDSTDHFLKHRHLRILLNLCKLFSVGLAVHKFSFVLFCLHGSLGFRATMCGSQKSHYPWLKCHEIAEEIDNDYVLRNDNRIKILKPISKILVSFFSEDNVLSDEVKLCYNIFEYQSNENQAFRFLGGHFS